MTRNRPNDGIWWNRANVPITGALFDGAILKPDHPQEIRIQRLRDRYVEEKATLSIERAKLFTASHRKTVGGPPMLKEREMAKWSEPLSESADNACGT